MKALATPFILILVLGPVSLWAQNRVNVELHQGEECIDRSAESPKQNVSESAIGGLLNTFSADEFCKDQFLVKNKFVEFCECESKKKFQEKDKELVKKSVIEREALSRELYKNSRFNKSKSLDRVLLSFYSLKLEIPAQCKKLISEQKKNLEDCQSNKSRWDTLKGLSSNEEPIALLDKELANFSNRRSLQQIVKDKVTSVGASYLLGISLERRTSLLGVDNFWGSVDVSSMADSLTTAIANQLNSDEYTISNDQELDPEMVLSSFISEADNNDFSKYLRTNPEGGSSQLYSIKSVQEQRLVSAELLPLFREKEFQDAFKVSWKDYVQDRDAEGKELTRADFQNILQRTLNKVINDNSTKGKLADQQCGQIIKSNEILCKKVEFDGIEVDNGLYQKHLASFFPARHAGKMACELVAKNVVPNSNGKITDYFRIPKGQETAPRRMVTKVDTSALDRIVDDLDSRMTNKSGDDAETVYINEKKKYRSSTVSFKNGSSLSRTYASAISSGDKSKINSIGSKVSKQKEERIIEAKEAKLAGPKIAKVDENGITQKITDYDESSEIKKIEELIKKNEELYGMSEEDQNALATENPFFNDPFNKKEKKDSFDDIKDYMSPINIEPEPVPEEELAEDEKEKFDGTKEKLDGLIERYENLIEDQKKKKEKLSTQDDEEKKRMEERIAKLQASLRNLENNRSNLMNSVAPKKSQKPVAKVISQPTPTPSATTSRRRSFSRSSGKSNVKREAASKAYIAETPQSGGLRSGTSYGPRESSQGSSGVSFYSGVSKAIVPVSSIKLSQMDQVISAQDFSQYKDADFSAYFEKYGSEPIVVKKKVRVEENGQQKEEEVLEYYFPEVDSGKIKYVKRNPELMRKAISHMMGRKHLETQLDLAIRSVAKHSDLIRLLENNTD